MQQIPKTNQWTNWEAVFSTRFVRKLRGVTIEEMLRSVPRCYKQTVELVRLMRDSRLPAGT
jgi:hypothetical protein